MFVSCCCSVLTSCVLFCVDELELTEEDGGWNWNIEVSLEEVVVAVVVLVVGGGVEATVEVE